MAGRLGPTAPPPSRTASVYWMRFTAQALTCEARSTASTAVISFQPATFTLPSRASKATATASGHMRTASCTTPGAATAAVPKITRSAPRWR